MNREPDAGDRQQPIARAWLDSGLLLRASALFLISLTLYWTTRTHYNTFDAVSYANQIENLYRETGDPRWLFHPHHLLFNALGYAVSRAAIPLGSTASVLTILAGMNAVFAAAGAAAFCLMLSSLLRRSRWLPLIMAAGLCLSYGFWVCATDGRVNMPSTVLVILAFWIALRLLDHNTIKSAAALGAVSGLAVLFHESASLFLPVAIAAVILGKRPGFEEPETSRFASAKMLAVLILSWIGMVIVPYALVATVVLKLRSFGAIHHWLTSYAELGWWWSFHLNNFRLDAYAIRRAAFAEPPGKQGTFHVMGGVPLTLLVIYFSTLAGWFAAVYAFLVALPLLWRTHYRPVMILSVTWIVTYAAFFTIWSPGYFVFWVPVLIPLTILLALSAAHYRSGRSGLTVNWLIAAWIFLYATVNYVGSIGPHQAPLASPFQRIGADIKTHTVPGDLVIVTGAGSLAQCEVDIPYFSGRECLSLHTLLTHQHDDLSASWAVAQARIQEALATGHNVYVLDEVFEGSDALDGLMKRHPGVTRIQIDGLLNNYNRSVAWRGDHGPVWKLNTPPVNRAHAARPSHNRHLQRNVI